MSSKPTIIVNKNTPQVVEIFSRLGNEPEALKWQEAVVSRDPGSKDTWYNMGIFYYNAAVRLQDSVLVNLSAFWTPDARGVGRFVFSIALFLSGFLMPLRFFPDWFVSLCNLTPFPSMVNTPIEVYLGVLSGPALAQALLTQVMWFAILTAACWLVMRAGVRRLVIQGG